MKSPRTLAHRSAWALCLLLLATTARAQEERTVAVLPLTGLGLSPDELLTVEGAFREAVRQMPGAVLQEREATRAALEKVRASGVTCDESDAACLQRLGLGVGTKEVVTGTVGETLSSYTLALRLVDVATGQTKALPSETISKEPAKLIVAMRSAAARLLDVYRGALLVDVAAPGAEILVDDVKYGASPLPAIEDLPVGKHRVEVRLAGHEPFARDVEVRVGEQARLAVAIAEGALVEGEGTAGEPAPGPDAPLAMRPLLLGTGAVVAGLGVAALIGGVVSGVGTSALERRPLDEGAGAFRQRVDAAGTGLVVTYALYGLGAAALLGGGAAAAAAFAFE